MLIIIVAIVIALVLFKLFSFLAMPIMATAALAYWFGPEVAGYAFLPLVALSVIASAVKH